MSSSPMFYSCDSCDYYPLSGYRWHCLQCDDFDMCESCHELGDIHDKTHTFKRIEMASSQFDEEVRKEGSFDPAAEAQKLLSKNSVKLKKQLTNYKAKEILAHFKLGMDSLLKSDIEPTNPSFKRVKPLLECCLLHCAIVLVELECDSGVAIPSMSDEDRSWVLEDARNLTFVLAALIVQIKARDKFDWFCVPVNRNVPNYYSIIEKPMDLGTLQKRLSNFYLTAAQKQIRSGYKGQRTKSDFLFEMVCDDLKLVWDNAIRFNLPDNALFPFAVNCRKKCNNILAFVRNALCLKMKLISGKVWDTQEPEHFKTAAAASANTSASQKRKAVPVDPPQRSPRPTSARRTEASRPSSSRKVDASRSQNGSKRTGEEQLSQTQSNQPKQRKEAETMDVKRFQALESEVNSLKSELNRMNAKIEGLSNLITKKFDSVVCELKGLTNA